MSLYRPILKKAWDISRRYKSLWFFGLFATIISSGGEYEIISRAIYDPTNQGGFITIITESMKTGIDSALSVGGNFWINMWQSIIKYPIPSIIALLLLIITITVGLFFAWIAVTSQIGIIRNISLIIKNKKPTINEGIDFGVKKFWPVLGMDVVLKIILFALFFILGQELILTSGGGIMLTIIYYLSFILFVFVVLIISFIIKYQIFYILLTNGKIIASLKSAYQLFIKNWIISLEMAFVLFLVYIVSGFISLLCSTTLSAIPLVIVPLYFSFLPIFVSYLIAIICFILMVLIIFFIAAFVTTFQWASWTALFMRINSGEESSKIERTVQQLQNIPAIFAKK